MVAFMTLQEFEKFRIVLEQQKFTSETVDPMVYGIQRDLFRKDKLKKLITVGARVESKTIQRKVERWQRLVQRLDKSQARLEKLRDEIANGMLRVEVPKTSFARVSSQASARA